MNSPDSLSRREALKKIGASAAVLGLGAMSVAAAADKAKTGSTAAAGMTAQPFALPKLDYAYDALEPHIDAKTMEIHHSKHHQAYITNANNALKDHAGLQKMSAEEILRGLNTVPEAVRTTLRNNVGGHVNHAFFWRVIGPNGGGSPSGALGTAITKDFGSLDA